MPSETITSMDVWQLSLPVVSRRDHGIGTVADSIDIVVVRLTSESGQVGFGEASPWSVFTGTAEACFGALDRYIRPHVIGQPVSSAASIRAAADRAVVHCQEAKAALDTALLDLRGKLIGVNVTELIGGRVRDEIPLSVSLADPDFDADLRLLERLHEDGVGVLKFKTGIKDHAFDLHRLETVRARYPQMDLRVDYNQGLAPTDALRQLRDIDAFGVTFIEQPVPATAWRTMRRLCAALDTPLLADETVFDLPDLLNAIETRLCDAVSIKIMKCGGPTPGLQLAATADAAGMAAYGGDMFESGLAHTAGTLMIACAPAISLGCEFYQARYYLQHDILAQPYPISAGHVQVPDAPGLGVEVDLDCVRHHAVVSGH